MVTPLESVSWIHGTPNCRDSSDPLIQVHALDEDTFILRLSKCFSFEGNFMYLLFGTERAIMFDTGAGPDPGGGARVLPLRRFLLGSHIEMKNEPREAYAIGTTFQPDEHPLPLGAAHLAELHAVCEEMADQPRDAVRDDFIVRPLTA